MCSFDLPGSEASGRDASCTDLVNADSLCQAHCFLQIVNERQLLLTFRCLKCLILTIKVFSLSIVARFESKNLRPGSGCGSVGRAVACNIRGPRFESSPRQN